MHQMRRYNNNQEPQKGSLSPEIKHLTVVAVRCFISDKHVAASAVAYLCKSKNARNKRKKEIFIE